MSRQEASKFLMSGLNTLLITALGWFYITNHNSDEQERSELKTSIHHADSLLTVIVTSQNTNFILDNSAHTEFNRRIAVLETDVNRWDIEYLPYIDFRGTPWETKKKK